MAYQKMAQLVKDKTKLQEIKTSLTFEEKQEIIDLINISLAPKNRSVTTAMELFESSFFEKRKMALYLKDLKIKSFINNFIYKNNTLVSYKKNLEKKITGKDFVLEVRDCFTEIKHPDVEAIVLSAKRIQASFNKDEKRALKTRSSALNLPAKTDRIDALKITLKISRLGGINVPYIIQDIAKIVTGKNLNHPKI